MSSISQNHVAVLAFPFGTHAAPLLNIIETLAGKHPNLKFSFFNSPESNSALFSKRSNLTANITACDVWDGVAGTGEEVHGHEATQRFVAAMPGNYVEAVTKAEEKLATKFGCFVTDAFIWFGGDLAEVRGGATWIALWTAGSCSLSAHLHTDQIRALANENATKQTLKDIPGLSKVPIDDVPGEILAENLDAPFPGMVYKMALNLHKANVVVLNTFQELEPTITNHLKSKLQKVLNIGPIVLKAPQKAPIPDEYNCLSWLDDTVLAGNGRVVYLSFGTGLIPPGDEIVALAEALEAKRAPFIWSMKPPGIAMLPEGFLDRTAGFGKVVPWAPQVQILSHLNVGAFVTHCGWNSILEAISFGVCMISRPFYGDQQMNSRVVESVWEIGVRVEGGVFTKSGTLKALELVLDSERGKELKENIKGLKEKAFEAIQPNGSSTKDFQELLHVFDH